MNIVCENYTVNVEGRTVREFASGAEAIAYYYERGYSTSENALGCDRLMYSESQKMMVEIFKRGLLDWIAVEMYYV